MKAKTALWVLACCAVLLIGSCGNPWMEKIVDPLFDVTEPLIPEPAPPPSTSKAITAFYFEINGKKYGAGPGTISGLGSINEAGHTITVSVPYAYSSYVSDPTTPVVISHTGVSVSPETAQNFPGSQTYTVTAADGSTQSYTVTVTVISAKLPLVSNSETDLRNLIEGAENGDTLIITGTFPVSSADSILIEGKDITILAPHGETLTFKPFLAWGFEKVFMVKNGGTLTLGGTGYGDIVFEGRNEDGEPFVTVGKGGTFIMNERVTMRDNTSGSGATASALEIRGTAIINGGTIINCTSDKTDDSSTIYLGSDDGSRAHLTINGGSIMNNTAPYNTGGSILVNNEGPHTLKWIGGTITGNTPDDKNYHSIYVKDSSYGTHTIELYDTAR
jgi:hypothetical protein